MTGPGEPTGGPRVVLVGPPGAGKSTAGELLARQLGVGFRDTDSDVEAATGSTIAEIFVVEGEQRFRALEQAAVAAALAEHDGVLALGGGSVLDPLTRELLSGHTVIFLDVTISDAAKRVGFNRDRPLLLGNPRAQWVQLMAERRPVYESISAHRVDTDGRTPDEVVIEIEALL